MNALRAPLGRVLNGAVRRCAESRFGFGQSPRFLVASPADAIAAAASSSNAIAAACYSTNAVDFSGYSANAIIVTVDADAANALHSTA